MQHSDSIFSPTQLENGYVYVPIVVNKEFLPDDKFICLVREQIPLDPHHLASTYNLEKIQQMEMYGYVANTDGDIVYMSGIEKFAEGCFRVETRTYVPVQFRTARWQCPHGYEAVRLQMKNISDSVRLWFKSRESKNKFSTLGYAHKYDGYSYGWKVFHEPIELKWKNNMQWIYYVNKSGMDDTDIIDLLRHRETQNAYL